MKIQVGFHETRAKFSLGFDDSSEFEIGFEEGFGKSQADPYTGIYDIVPRVTAQSLPTRNRWLNRDVTVQAIPYHEVENTERGTTAIIGGI